MEPNTRNVGFASMDRRKQKEIARKGGVAAHRKGTAHEFTVEEARNAGRKGGQHVSANRAHMMEIGRVGGLKSAERRRNRATAPVEPHGGTEMGEEHGSPEMNAMPGERAEWR